MKMSINQALACLKAGDLDPEAIRVAVRHGRNEFAGFIAIRFSRKPAIKRVQDHYRQIKFERSRREQALLRGAAYR